MAWTYEEILKFATGATGEKSAREVEGPAVLGPYTVWRAWTYDGSEYNAHYVVAEKGSQELSIFQNFQPFANWLMDAFNVKDAHTRRLEWFRSAIAAMITLTLLALLVWAVLRGQAAGIDYKWLAGALAATSLGYLLGGWTRRPG